MSHLDRVIPSVIVRQLSLAFSVPNHVYDRFFRLTAKVGCHLLELNQLALFD